MGSVDGWPLATPDTEIPGGSRPAVAAVRRRDRGVRTLLPRAGRPTPACHSGGDGPSACGPALRGLVGAIGWPPAPSPVRRGGRGGRALRAPQPTICTLTPPGIKPCMSKYKQLVL
ncbi:hypothetical protein N7492_004194 [Penicillium capsulatum]|uniref:Uncharacterized protein n=1 Tax=Penicillium capsulatum TaxID=69766 RepID=A0A9W9I9T6_9EURO|nr:hypothetical protein N7492_004194 [Penicillium capsulatum]